MMPPVSSFISDHTMSMTDDFRHDPLDTTKQEIRLVSFLPTTHGPIQCCIRHFDLGQDVTPEYRALSYTWGPPSPARGIQLNGMTFTVRENLHDFLEVFRKRLVDFSGPYQLNEDVEWIWVDQICINQQSTSERNHQVQMMSEIYRRAIYVYVWLGSSNASTETAMRAFKTEYRQHYHRGESETHREAKSELGSKKSPAGPIEGGDWMSETGVETRLQVGIAVTHFFTNPYWGRLWIVQEIMLARYIRIFCGHTLLLWNELAHFCSHGIKHLPAKARQSISAQVHWLAEHALSAKTFGFSSLLKTFCTNSCEDPRDKVYGLQGLLHPDERLSLLVDYAKPVCDVFMDAAFTILQGEYEAFSTSFTDIADLDYEKPVEEVFNDAALAMMHDASERSGLRLMETITTLAQQMGTDIPILEAMGEIYCHHGLEKHWNDLAQVYAASFRHGIASGANRVLPVFSQRLRVISSRYDTIAATTNSFFERFSRNFPTGKGDLLRLPSFRSPTPSELIDNFNTVDGRLIEAVKAGKSMTSRKAEMTIAELWRHRIQSQVYSNSSLGLSDVATIAKSFGSYNKYRYVAGLWLETLILDLCWCRGRQSQLRELEPGNHRTYEAPSWSWASGHQRVTWGHLGGDIQELASVEETHMRRSGEDEYGRVNRGSYLVLRAKMTHVTCSLPEIKVVAQQLFDYNCLDIPYSTYALDSTGLPEHFAQLDGGDLNVLNDLRSHGVWLLPLADGWSPRSWRRTFGLLVIRTPSEELENIYRRVGSYCFEDFDQEGFWFLEQPRSVRLV